MNKVPKKIALVLLVVAVIASLGVNGYVLAADGCDSEETVGAYIDDLRERGCDNVQVTWENDGGIRIVWTQGTLMFAHTLY